MLLTGAALVGLATASLTGYAAARGMHAVVVMSGSMTPTMPIGTLLVTQRIPADQAHLGEVVSVVGAGGRVTHRVVGIDRRGATTLLTLRGDANSNDDPTPYAVTTADRVRLHLPTVGRLAGVFATGPGGFGLGALVAGLVMGLGRHRPGSWP